MDHEVLDFPRMIANIEKMNMRQEDHEKGQETKTMVETKKKLESILLQMKETITQDIRGSPPTWGYVHQLFFSLLSFVNHLHAQSHKILLRIGQEIYAHFARSSFPKLGYSTKSSYNLDTSFLQPLALRSTSVQHSIHKAFTTITFT